MSNVLRATKAAKLLLQLFAGVFQGAIVQGTLSSCLSRNSCQWHRSGVFIVNFEHISHLVLVFLLLTLNM